MGASDLIVYTPAEWVELLEHPTPLVATARREWVALIGPDVT